MTSLKTSIKTITYLSDIGCLEIQGASLKSLDYWLMQINQMHIPLLKKRGIIKDERDLLDNPCLNIKIGTEILYNHFSRCGVTWQCLGTYNAGFAMDNQKKRQQYAPKYILYIPGLMN